MNDYGSGSGKGALELYTILKDAKINLIDIADNALDEGILDKIPGSVFYHTPLWLMQDVPRASYGYCVDVMEHIPTAMVDEVLFRIATKTEHSCYFCIALFPDKWYGENLHLTVRPRDWWETHISRYFKISYIDANSNHLRVVGDIDHAWWAI